MTNKVNNIKRKIRLCIATVVILLSALLCLAFFGVSRDSQPAHAEEAYAAQIGSTNYATFNAAWSAKNSGSTIKLLKNSSTASGTLDNLTVPVTIDLNGHVLTVTQSTQILTVSGGVLNIIDSAPDVENSVNARTIKGGVIVFSGSGRTSGINVSSGALNLSGGTLTSGVYCSSSVIYGGANVNITGGAISYAGSRAIYLRGNGTLSMTGGEISYNDIAATADGKGSAVYATDGTVLSFGGGSIIKNKGTHAAVYLHNGAKMKALANAKPTVISQNIATTSGVAAGVGSESSASSKLEIVDGGRIVITGNYNSADKKPSNLKLDGSIVNPITVSGAIGSGTRIGVYAPAPAVALTTGYGNKNASILPGMFFFIDGSGSGSGYRVSYSASSTEVISSSSGHVAALTFAGTTTGYTTFAGALGDAKYVSSSSGRRATVTLFADVETTVQNEITSGKYVTLDLNGYVYKETGGQHDLFILNSGSDFLLQDSSPYVPHAYTVDDNGMYVINDNILNQSFDKVNSIYGGVLTGAQIAPGGSGPGGCFVVRVNSSSTFTMSGGNIAGNLQGLSGGCGVGVYGTFKMNGGVITGNVGGSGAGVYVYGGSFTMSGGEISNNSPKGAGVNGGGVCVTGSFSGTTCTSVGTFTMNTGTICGNTAVNGGGVYVGASGTAFILNNSKITDNKSTGTGDELGGGGIGVVGADAKCSISGTVAVSGNSATRGGGVSVGTSGSFTMQETPTISGNNGAWGGGVYVSGGTFKMSSGTIGGDNESKGNSAGSGGGVFVEENSTFTMDNGTISYNTTSSSFSSGGGVCVSGGNFTMNNGTVSNNIGGYGGGVEVTGTFTMKGGTISGNTAKKYGGGVDMGNGGTFNVSGAAKITENKLNSTVNNVELSSGQKITVIGALKASNVNAQIGVTLASGYSGVFTTGYKSYNGTVDPVTYFIPDAGGCLWLNGSEVSLSTQHSVTSKTATAATCTTAGNLAYWYCSQCTKYYSNSTCTTLINNSKQTNTNNPTLPALGHSITTKSAKAATCTADGEIEHDYCSTCQKHFVKGDSSKELTATYGTGGYLTKALGHNMVLDKTNSRYVAATCLAGGRDTKKCNRSGCTHTEESTTAKLDHTGTLVAYKASTCAAKGNYEYYKCVNGCNQYFYNKDKDANHVCEVSTSELSGVEIPKLPHTESATPSWDWASNHSTCNAVFSCTVCKGVARTEAATVSSVERAPSCTEAGKMIYTATYGGYEDVVEVASGKAALGHDWNAHWGSWTENADGWTNSVVIRCSRNSDHVGTPVETVKVVCTTTDATCVATGKKVYTASIKFSATQTFACPMTKEVTLAIDPDAHDLELHAAKAVTCEGIGWNDYYTCKRSGCGYTTYKEISPLGHDWSSAQTALSYTAFDKFNVNGLVLVCSRDEKHTHAYDAAKDTANVIYLSGDCLHATDKTVDVEVTVDGKKKTYTVSISVAKKQVTIGSGKWLNDGSELMSGYVKADGEQYKYYPVEIDGVTDDADPVTEAVVRYVANSTIIIDFTTDQDSLLDDIEYVNCQATASGMFNASATLTLKDTVNYVFVTPTVSGATLDATTGKITATLTWYAAIYGNGFKNGIASFSFGSTTVPSLPELEFDSAESPATISLVLKRNGVSIGEPFTKATYSDYINSTMPEGSYTLNATVGTVTVDDIDYSGFERTFTFTVSKATFEVDGIAKITAVYNGEVHIEQTFAPKETLITAGNNVWARDAYKSLYGGAAISYSHTNWNGEYKTATEIGEMTDNTLFVNAGSYTALYKISALNYVDVTGSFAVEIAKDEYDMKGITFDGGKPIVYDGETHSIAISGDLPDGVTVKYYYVKSGIETEFNGVKDADDYTITAKFTGDAANYELIDNMTATLTINRAIIDLNLEFNDVSYTYCGDTYSLVLKERTEEGLGELTESLLKYIDVDYSGNSGILKDTYSAKATVKIKSEYAKNYEFDDGSQSRTYNATLTITAAEYNMEVSFEDKEVAYTGKAYSLYISGKLPADVTYSYENNNCVEVGTHVITVRFYTSNPNYNAPKPMTAELNICKAKYNMDNVAFPDAMVVYNGKANSLSIRGTLPAGVTYTYVNNSRTEVGSQIVTVKFFGDTENYEPIKDMTATLRVTPASLGAVNVSLESMTVAYDGNKHSLAVNGNLPDGVEVKYYVIVDGNEVEFDGVTTAGVYDVIAKFILPDSENYKAIRPLSAKLTVTAPEVPVKPPVVEPTVAEIEMPTVDNEEHDLSAPAVIGDPLQAKDFPYWIIWVCVVGAEVVAMAVMGCYIAFGVHKKKKR